MQIPDDALFVVLRPHTSDILADELLGQGVDPASAQRIKEMLTGAASSTLTELVDWYHAAFLVNESVAMVGLLRHFAIGARSTPGYSRGFLERFSHIEASPNGRVLLALVKTQHWITSGHPSSALEEAERAVSGSRSCRGDALSIALRTSAHLLLSDALRRLGNFRRTLRNLEAGLESATRLGIAWEFRNRLAALQWASGNYRTALELHCNEEDRREARERGDWDFVIRSHLSAAKCAIDMRVSAKANAELIAAEELLDQAESPARTLRPYLILFSAELDTLWGNEREGIHLFEYAIELFSELDPPYYPGILDAKISLIQFALRTDKSEQAFDRVAELLDEAEERGCLDARSRLLVYQANLLLDKGVSMKRLQEGYDDLIHRAHLMNNPRLTFIAYANLYAYAREHLNEYDQRFWLKRLRGLEPLLEASCFDDLYRDYVLERYRHEIEGPLDQLEDDLEQLGR